MDQLEVRKYIDQAQRKKEYNRKYYQTHVKPKNQSQKTELEELRQENRYLKEMVDYQRKKIQQLMSLKEEILLPPIDPLAVVSED